MEENLKNIMDREWQEVRKDFYYPQLPQPKLSQDVPNGQFNFENLQIKKGDIADIDFVNSLEEADYIIHAAGYGQPGKFLQDKIKTIAINTTATMSLLKKLNSDGKFLFISTSEI